MGTLLLHVTFSQRFLDEVLNLLFVFWHCFPLVELVVVLESIEDAEGLHPGVLLFLVLGWVGSFQDMGCVDSREIVDGHLVSTFDGREWDIRYSQISSEHETASGHSVGTVKPLDDGRVRVEDKWKWESQDGSGESILKQVA